MRKDARRLLIRNGFAALILGPGIFMLVAAFGSIDGLADPSLRLRALVILFAGIAAIRLILVSLLDPPRPWSLLIGGTVLALTLASELPAFL